MIGVRKRPWALLFLVSLALNLFLGGMLTARWLYRPRFKDIPQPFGMLGPEELPVARRVWKQHRHEWDPKQAAVADARKRAADALTADPFDERSAAQSLEQLRVASSAVQQSFHGILVEVAGELPGAQRRKLRHALDFQGRSIGHPRSRWGGISPNDESFPPDRSNQRALPLPAASGVSTPSSVPPVPGH